MLKYSTLSYHWQQKATTSFKLDAFITALSQELLNLAKKNDILDIASHYNMPNVKPSILNHEIKNIIIQFLVGEVFF